MTDINNNDDSLLSNTCSIIPSSSSNDDLNNLAAAAYYNCAFDIVGKRTHSDPTVSRPTSPIYDDGVQSDVIKHIRSRREAARIQYQRILCHRKTSTPSPGKGEDGMMKSKTDCESNSPRTPDVPVTLFPSSLRSPSDRHSPLSHESEIMTGEDKSDVGKFLRMEDIAIDEDGANFETIIGGNSDNFNCNDSAASEVKIQPTPTTSDDAISTFSNIPSFAQEHSIFVQAILQLLTERDQQYLKGSSNRDIAILKTGSLKKISHRMFGMWKNKFVELRAGSLTYYEYSGDDDYYTQLKCIPLRAPLCKCRVVEPPIYSIGGAYVFELLVGSGIKRFWMANSAVERNEWVTAIQSAIIDYNGNERGGDRIIIPTHGDLCCQDGERYKYKPKAKVYITPQPHCDDRGVYLQVQKMCKKASSKEQYIKALSKINGHTLNVPVNWVKEFIASMSSDGFDVAFKEESVDINIEQFWKDMLRDTVSINEKVLSGDSLHGPEKIVGCLTRSILDLDRIATKQEAKVMETDANHTNRFCIKESEAVFYARDLLLSSNRTRSGGHSYYCASTLCNNPSLVVVVPNSTKAEPLRLTLRHMVPIEYGQDNTRKHEESLLSDQLKVNICPVIPQCEQTRSKRKFVFPRELPILSRFHHLTERSNPTSNDFGSKDVTSNVTSISSIGEETITDESTGGDRATIEVLVKVSSEYKICTTDPSGNAIDDTWCFVKALFLQNFYIGGGPNGGIQKGDARIQFCAFSSEQVSNCC